VLLALQRIEIVSRYI